MKFGPHGQRIANMSTRWWFKLYAFRRLPSLWFWGVRVNHLSHNACEVKLPFNWFTKNPFQSVYFSAMAGAAELSTGLIVMAHLADRGRWSMLVTSFHMDFVKKAKETVLFTCEQGDELVSILEAVDGTLDHCTLKMNVEGKTVSGEVVARAQVEWSLKPKANS